jgi:hypothetical protein
LYKKSLTYLLCFYKTEKKRSINQALQEEKYTIKKRNKNMTIPIISTFYSVTDEQNKKRRPSKKK